MLSLDECMVSNFVIINFKTWIMDKKEIIQNCFKMLFENPIYDQTIIEKYFSENYIQYVDGEVFDYKGFVKHIQKLKELTKGITIVFNHIVSEHNTVFTNHTVTIIRENDLISKVKVIATFLLEDDKIVFCDELTYHEEGDMTISNYGSVV